MRDVVQAVEVVVADGGGEEAEEEGCADFAEVVEGGAAFDDEFEVVALVACFFEDLHGDLAYRYVWVVQLGYQEFEDPVCVSYSHLLRERYVPNGILAEELRREDADLLRSSGERFGQHDSEVTIL